jgi:hypothetical protein
MELTQNRFKSVRVPSGGNERSECGGLMPLTQNRFKSVRAPSGGRARSVRGALWN